MYSTIEDGQRRKICNARNGHHGKRGGFSVALSDTLSVACSNTLSLFSGIFQHMFTFLVDVHWKCPMDFQRHSPMEFHSCDFWCVTFCPEPSSDGRMTYSQFSSAKPSEYTASLRSRTIERWI